MLWLSGACSLTAPALSSYDSQSPSTNRLVVGAPQEIKAADQTGGLYQCDCSVGKCEPIPLQVPPEAVNMSLGLSLAFATKPFRLLACGPTVHQICKGNTYVNGFCFLFVSNLLQQPRRLPEALRGCPQQDSDIAFLIDGSGSISPTDFQKMKNFVSTVMSQFPKSKTLFSLMQYSEEFQTHFTFNDFKRNPSPEFLVRPIMQLLGRTHTATAIRKVVRELFHSRNGSRENAHKILVVITDGEKYGDPLDYKDVIPEADRKGVIRYVIGVGAAFFSDKSLKELNTIASKPPGEHVFQVNNFEALKTIQNQLQEKIFAIEGTHTGSTSSFEYEMSQEGFSAVFTSDGPLLGAVGSFDWAGGAFLHTSKDKVTFINTTRVDSDMNDAYLGYAAEAILQNRVQILLLGAPRYQHIGLVVIFKKNAGAWEKNAEIKGSQIGSYFGASLSSVDVDRDGSSDLVLIGAPHYYEQSQGGQVSVCPFPRGRAKWQCGVVLRGEQGHLWARFGAALTVLGDVNGDRLTDVAIGAPGEQENRGAVYLFHGTSGLGLSPAHSQRITGSQFSPRLQYFGQSLSGGQDLTMDGLVDLAVGAQGHVLLLRSQPVLKVEATMEFTPREVARDVYECRERVVKGLIAGEVRVCLRVRKSTLFLLSYSCHCLFFLQLQITFNITFDVNPDAFFGNKLLLKANVTSENNIPGNNKTEFQLQLPVKYAVYIVVTSLEVSTKYLNFTASENTSHIIEHQYQFNNLGGRKLPISVVFLVPIQLNRVTVWDQLHVTFSQNLSSRCHTNRSDPRDSDFLGELKKTPLLNCSIAVCQRIQCDIPSFGVQEEFKVTLKGNLSFDWYIKTSHNHLQLVSTAEILFDGSEFALLPGQGAFVRAQTETKVESYEVHNPVPLIVGSSAGGLLLLALVTGGLYKLGFFKRQYKDMITEAGPETALPQ
ncbi:integrin alpha-M [Physeter macrocephalus]|uniref:Integrin alpha-M n=1 Tax=Physeter macrocephalus TaxID=9755 RepID=A0A455BXU7_PHYMC|nr:integrin alpha-M [Physeter catodon]|eukprot:XP_028353839.1 integrin alpha-M [Physeter catodon]